MILVENKYVRSEACDLQFFTENQDRFIVALAHGMGGHNAGEVASDETLRNLNFFSNNMYVSGVHAQLLFKQDSGWCVLDKHSSNGTKLNQRDLLPDVPMSVKNGDILTIANVSLQVSIK